MNYLSNSGQAKIDEVKQSIKEQRDLIQSRDAEITDKKNEEKKLKGDVNALSNAIEGIRAKMESNKRENAQDNKDRKLLEDRYTWINNDKHVFGKEHSPYDFNARNPQRGKLL